MAFRRQTVRWTLAAMFALLANVASATLVYTTLLDGASEAPPNASPGTGSSTVTIDPTAHTMRLETIFSGLIGTTTAAHIHCCTAVPGAGTVGVATQVPFFLFFPIGVTAGSYDHTFDLTDATSWNSAFVTAHGGTLASAEADFISGLNSGRGYLNIHTTFAPGGEIRGFLVVPAPGTLALAALGLGILCWRRRTPSAPR